MRRIGWTSLNGISIISPSGSRFDLLACPPGALKHHVYNDTQAYLTKRMCSNIDPISFADGFVDKPLLIALRGNSTNDSIAWPPPQKEALRTVLSGSGWSTARKFEANILDSLAGTRCPAPVDDTFHACAECSDPALSQLRGNISEELKQEFSTRSDDRNNISITQGIFSCIHVDPPIVVATILTQHDVRTGSNLYHFSKFIFLDGSGVDPTHR